MTTPISLISLIAFLTSARACDASLAWLRSLPAQTTPAQAWAACRRADWLLWLLWEICMEKRVILLAACACAERALTVLPPGESRPRRAIEETRLWCSGETVSDAAMWGVRAAFREAVGASPSEFAACAAMYCLGEAHAMPSSGFLCQIPSLAAEAIAGPRSEDVEAELARMADLFREIVPWSAVEARLAEVLPASAEVLS